MKKLFYVLTLVLFSLQLSAQRKIFNKVFSDDTTRHNSFLPLPLLGYSQEAGLTLGAVGIYSFYTDKNDPNIKASQAYGVVGFSTKKRVQISFKTDVWTAQNKYHYIAEAKFINQPFNFYGIGNHTSLADEDKVNLRRFKLNGELEREVFTHFYLGGGLEYENQKFTAKDPAGIYSISPVLNDRDGGEFMFFKATSFFDSRDNVPYPSKGFYAKLQYGYAPNFFGSPNYNGSLVTADLRNFYTLTKSLNIALNATYEGLISNKVIPFYNLRQLGNDQFMRGYYSGRFRDENLITSQAEIRYRPIPRFGVVAFGGAGKVYGKNSFSQSNFKPTYGLGARFFFDLEKGLALRIDYAMGEKPVGEKRISGFYISLGEAF
ncbi:BamA/TamA family outer membrane protein [Pedobacter arcticus]|uniref:BamA/TamA family outer membrane protein n=1 Tax=Pedobacter arcticus TaxID=752140 RepID=UPI0002EFB178|nr:BamA/TamA family outer membrane protein [Pedobacter arcticus]